jgi:hypothetical protein
MVIVPLIKLPTLSMFRRAEAELVSYPEASSSPPDEKPYYQSRLPEEQIVGPSYLGIGLLKGYWKTPHPGPYVARVLEKRRD